MDLLSPRHPVPLTRQECRASLGSGVKGREMDWISLSIGGRRADRRAEMQRLSYIRHFATPFKNGRRGVSTSFRPFTAVCTPFVTPSVPFCSLPFLIRSDKNYLSCILYWPFLLSTKSVWYIVRSLPTSSKFNQRVSECLLLCFISKKKSDQCLKFVGENQGGIVWFYKKPSKMNMDMQKLVLKGLCSYINTGKEDLWLKVKAASNMQLSSAPTTKWWIISSNQPGPACTMAAAVADWGKAAPGGVRGTRGQAGPCGEAGGAAGWAGPRSGTPAWAGWCAAAGRAAACAGCGSGSCAEAGEARRSAETAAEEGREDERRRFISDGSRYKSSAVTAVHGVWQILWHQSRGTAKW